jgi:hypothetical protein
MSQTSGRRATAPPPAIRPVSKSRSMADNVISSSLKSKMPRQVILGRAEALVVHLAVDNGVDYSNTKAVEEVRATFREALCATNSATVMPRSEAIRSAKASGVRRIAAA